MLVELSFPRSAWERQGRTLRVFFPTQSVKEDRSDAGASKRAEQSDKVVLYVGS